MRESYTTVIAPVVAEKWEAERSARLEAGDISREPKAGFRAGVARSVFAALPSDQRASLGDRAKKEAADAKDAYLKALKDPPPQDPESRQRYGTIRRIRLLTDTTSQMYQGNFCLRWAHPSGYPCVHRPSLDDHHGWTDAGVWRGIAHDTVGLQSAWQTESVLIDDSVSYGRNKTALGQHWPQWDKARFGKDVQGFMGDYLKTAFSAYPLRLGERRR